MAWSNTEKAQEGRKDSLQIPGNETDEEVLTEEFREPEIKFLRIVGKDLDLNIKIRTNDSRTTLDRIEECIKNGYIFSVKEKKIGGAVDLRINAKRISAFWLE